MYVVGTAGHVDHGKSRLVRALPGLLRALVERGDLVDVGDDVQFLRSVYEEMTGRIAAWIERHGSITVGQARDMLSTTRRYVGLLDHLDEKQVTRRAGDERVLRKR